eukprot:gnl/TRDRNA2_/TRDRNA2_93977_c0_seq1.p1 gnl/TRDRNA2_/TRDRNA2_93977_c0~~gnl/TRDRNA2_/TRDRNA2_93977_c0_seq1.p1  ORF type:complete len:619 (+),score=73.40 gnl/TRDRNA2_/TRDRNA2_93977_c0_seq1:84-1940(+)
MTEIRHEEQPASGTPVKRKQKSLPWQHKVTYGLVWFFDGAIISLMATWMPYYYADVNRVDPSLVGPVTGGIVATYALGQPFVGFLSDKLGYLNFPAQGRRRPYLLLFCGPAAIGHTLCFNPPMSLFEDSGNYLGAAMYALSCGCLCMLSVGGIEVMMQALAPVIAHGYDQRTELALVDALSYGIGFACGPILPPVWNALGLAGSEDPMGQAAQRTKFSALSLFFSIGIAVTTPILIYTVREPPPQTNEGVARIQSGAAKGSRCCCGEQSLLSRPALIFLVYYVLALGSTATAVSMMPFFSKFFLESELAFNFGPALATMGSLCCVPFWISGMYRWEKSKVLRSALVVMSLAALLGLCAPQGPDGELVFFFAVGALSMGIGGYACAPAAIKPDICDYDELCTGRRREGRLLAMWLATGRFSSAILMGGSLTVLAACGFDTRLLEQPASARNALRGLGFGVPLVAYICAAITISLYPINRKKLEEIQMSVVTCKAGLDGIKDPLRPTRTISWSDSPNDVVRTRPGPQEVSASDAAPNAASALEAEDPAAMMVMSIDGPVDSPSSCSQVQPTVLGTPEMRVDEKEQEPAWSVTQPNGTSEVSTAARLSASGGASARSFISL